MVTIEQGETEYENGDHEAAFKIYLCLAENGDPKAQVAVASMLQLGDGTQQNLEEAIKWYKLSALQGHPVAQNNLGTILLDTDPQAAIHWLLSAAEKDFPFAQSMLGDIYSGTYDLPQQESIQNVSEAIKWYERAGANGYEYAAHQLAEMFAHGENVAKDEKRAVDWYMSAARKGYEPSLKVLSQACAQGLLGLPKNPEQSDYWLAQIQ
jgi:uncharacterized protein